MAKFEKKFRGNVQHFLKYIDDSVREGSISSSLEDVSNYQIGDVVVGVRVYERYSYWGGNRVSLNVTVVSNDDNIYITAITSGGSQAVFFKINTWGEGSFLDNFERYVQKYIMEYAQ